MRCAIIEADQSIFHRVLTTIELSYIDSFALESFYEGLPPECRTELRNSDYQNLDEAYDKAILAAKRLERDRARRRGQSTQAYIPPVTSPPSLSNPAARDSPPVSILTRATAPPSRAPRVSPNSFPTKICTYCKNRGHLISECRKRRFNNTQKEHGDFQGNVLVASANEESRGQPTACPMLPSAEIPRPSTTSDPQPGVSRQ